MIRGGDICRITPVCAQSSQNLYCLCLQTIRVMPNTPSLVGEGATVYSLGSQCSQPREGKIIEALFAGVGRECHLVPETHIDAVTGISGSGPAYMYMIIGKSTTAPYHYYFKTVVVFWGRFNFNLFIAIN